jgi:hypothetical protein
MKIKILILAFAGIFLWVSCDNNYIEPDETTKNENSEDQDSKDKIPDDIVEIVISGDQGPEDLGSRDVIPDAEDTDYNFQYSHDADLNTYFIGHIVKGLADGGDVIWAGVDSILVKMDKTSGETIGYNRPVPGAYIGLGTIAHSIALSKAGLTWISWSGPQPYLETFDEAYWNIIPLPPETFGFCFTIDINDEVWLSTMSGLSKYSGNEWIDYNWSISEFSNCFISSLTVDNQNNKWLGIYPGSGISQVPLVKFDGSDFTMFTSDCLNDAEGINSIAVSPGEIIWLGTKKNGLIRFDGINWEVYNQSNSGLPDNSVRQVAIESDTVIWNITESGLTRFDGKNWNTVIQDDNLLSILIDEAGKKWIGTESGLVVIE